MAISTFRKIATSTTTDVSVPTTTETVVISSGPLSLPLEEGLVAVKGYVIMTTGAGTSAVTLRIRRGTTATGTLVGEGNAVATAASASVALSKMTTERRDIDTNTVEYSLTVQQTAAIGNGTISEAYIEVEVIN